ncbi:MAG: hypothetical protein M1420_00300 [Actinobacteria bacterium]|nr:hypothetical protein [Actinomycetota bacterium]
MCKTGCMLERRWFDASQPQTLQIAVILEYLNAGLALLFLLLGMYPIITALFMIAEGVGANGVANEQRWGYNLSVGSSVGYLALTVVLAVAFGGIPPILTIILSVALVALLLHPMSKSYQKIYFH